jgi:hypothetical protein
MTSPQVVSTNKHLLQLSPRSHLSAESRYDHDIFRPQLIDLIISRFSRDRHDSQASNLIIHLRIMNDLSQKENPAIGVRAPRRVSQINRSLYPVAESEFLGQLDGQISG